MALGVLYDLFGPVVHEVAPLPVADEGAVRAVTRSSRDARGRGRGGTRKGSWSAPPADHEPAPVTDRASRRA
ncbi:MAG TPA: hypothetical protein VNO31_23195 [Umezawaea sp.]|nr:hypothetical protein [Umezawaea sp.]